MHAYALLMISRTHACTQVRVEKPLATHFEWVSFFQQGNFAGVKKYMDSDVVYYMIMHTISPATKAAPGFNAVKFVGQDEVFKRLDNEMSRQGGNVAVVSPTITGPKLKDLRLRRAAALEAEASEVAFAEKNPNSADVQAKVAIAKEAYEQCLTYGGPGDGPKRSIIHFAGRWLPLGEGSERKGKLVCTVRETIGWKYQSKPAKPGPDGEPAEDKPSAARGVGMLCREFFVHTEFYQPAPAAPGFEGMWRMYKQRSGK